MLTPLFALAGSCLSALLAARPPLELEGAAQRRYLLASSFVAAWTGLCPGSGPDAVVLANILLWMTATDMRERMLYDVHFSLLLLGGVICALFQPLGGLIGRAALFLVLFGVLFLASRRSGQLGMGDSRTIAALALYFPLSGWMEVMLLSLGGAMIWGLWGVARGKRTMKTEFPFMPFLLAGVLLEFLLRGA